MTNLTLRNGQSCFYFSHGCTIHCDKCDGKTARFGSTCGNEKTAEATICAPALRTLNRKAECGSKDDKCTVPGARTGAARATLERPLAQSS